MIKVAFLLSILAALPLVAQEGERKPQPPQQGDRVSLGDREVHRQRLINRFDVNKDGKLDAQEKAAMDQFIEERRKNGSPHGQRAPQRPNRQEIIKRFDKNQDGKLDDQERAEMEKALQNRRARRGERAPRSQQ